jgi:hypothetical protein
VLVIKFVASLGPVKSQPFFEVKEAVGEFVGVCVGSWNGDVGEEDVGKWVGREVVGDLDGTGEGNGLGTNEIEGARVGEEVRGVKRTLHFTQESVDDCSPSASMYKVSGVVWSVSSSLHWSSWTKKLTELEDRSKIRTAANLAELVDVPNTPKIPGGLSY